MISITEAAAGMILKSKAQQPDPDLCLRISARMTPQYGLVYNMGFDQPQPEDQQYQLLGVDLVVDRNSLLYVDQLVLDFGALEGEEQFLFENPLDQAPQTKDACGTTPGSGSCGTGCSCG